VLLGDWKLVQNVEDTLDNLKGWERVVWVLEEPHLKDSATLHLEEDVLKLSFSQCFDNKVDHFKAMHSSLLLFDGFMVQEACLMHVFDQVKCRLLALVVQVFLSFDLDLSPVGIELMRTLEPGQQVLPRPLSVH
jgi:hypothetical protein